MYNPVMLSDLEARWRPLTADEKIVAQALLDDAWSIASAQVPGLPLAVDSNRVPLGVVRATIASMVVRVLRNPEGVRQWSVDDYSETRDASVAGGALYMSPEERNLLALSIGQRRPGAFSVAPAPVQHPRSRGAEYEDDRWPIPPGYRW